MAGIYIHIPFCKSKCGYCNFYSVASLRMKCLIIKALLSEIELTSDILEGSTVETIYFGGGTPSLLDTDDLAMILKTLKFIHHVSVNCEITLEANPDDVTPEHLQEWISTGFNRISLGIQSFNTQDLAYLDRKHSPQNALYALELISAAPLGSFSVDLIYAIPGQTTDAFSENLRICISAGTPHLSCYSLTVEEKTPLNRNILKGTKPAPTDNLFIEHWNLLTEITKNKGFLHYETSNFCKPQHFSKHNVNYWNDIPYLGLGPSAHSYNLKSRSWNHMNLTKYIDGITSGSAVAGEEILTTNDHINEHIMTRLRTMWGISLNRFSDTFGTDNLELLLSLAVPFFARGWLKIDNNTMKITDTGMPLTDAIISSLFVTKP